VAVVVTNLIQGPADLWHGWYGDVTEPGLTSLNDSPAGTGGWSDMGGTQDGVKLTVGLEWSELEVDQIVDIPGRRLTKRDAQIGANLAEGTLENMVRAMNGGVSATGTGYKTFEPVIDMNSAVEPDYAAIILDGIAPNGLRRRVNGRKTLNIENMEGEYKKDGMFVIPTMFGTHFIADDTAPYRIQDATS
jgi:hypothetical protein